MADTEIVVSFDDDSEGEIVVTFDQDTQGVTLLEPELTPPDPVVIASGPAGKGQKGDKGDQGDTGPAGPPGSGSSDPTDLLAHIEAAQPHPAYDLNMPDFALIWENRIA